MRIMLYGFPSFFLPLSYSMCVCMHMHISSGSIFRKIHQRQKKKKKKRLIQQQIYFGISTPFSSLSLFTPAITSGLGYTSLRAQLMTVPPWAVAYVVTTAVAWSADYFNRLVYFSFSFILCKIYININMLQSIQSRPPLRPLRLDRRNGIPRVGCSPRRCLSGM